MLTTPTGKCPGKCLLEEFGNTKWAEINRMHLNLAKTKEIGFRWPNTHLDLIPSFLTP